MLAQVGYDARLLASRDDKPLLDYHTDKAGLVRQLVQLILELVSQEVLKTQT